MQSLTVWVYRAQASLPDTQGTVHSLFDPTAIPSFADGFADSRGTVLFRRGNLAAGTCASLWFGDDPAILCNLPDLFWCNNVLIQTGYSSTGNEIKIELLQK